MCASVVKGGGSEPLGALTTTSTLIDLAVAGRSLFYNCHVTVTEIFGQSLKCFVPPGENKVSVSSALSFVKLLFQYKQSEAFSRLTKEMLQLLSVSHRRSSVPSFKCAQMIRFSDWFCVAASGSAWSVIQEGRVRAGSAGQPQQPAVFSEEPRQRGYHG